MKLEPIPEVADNYIHSEVIFSRGNSNEVIRKKQDVDSSIVIRADHILILDACCYVVEFGDVEVTELSANFIAESIYVQCDVDGNKCLLQDFIVDYHMSDEALTLNSVKLL